MSMTGTEYDGTPDSRPAPGRGGGPRRSQAAPVTQSDPAPAPAPVQAAPPPAGSEMTTLLGRLGVNYANAPAANPALLAFLRGVGLNLSTAEDMRNRTIGKIEDNTVNARQDLDRSATRAKRNTTTDLIARGVLSSGQANTRYSRQAEEVAARRADIERTRAQGIGDVDDAFRQTQDSYRMQALERVLGHEQQLTTEAATAKAQQDAYDRADKATQTAADRERESQDAHFRRLEELYKRYGAQGVSL
jgi:hypothetical protein